VAAGPSERPNSSQTSKEDKGQHQNNNMDESSYDYDADVKK
jgi:hypothetical protein